MFRKEFYEHFYLVQTPYVNETIMHNEGDQIKEDEVGGECSTSG
jgi:hypothetical protein